jgi:hypothetical protein
MKHMAHEAQPALATIGLAIEPRIGIAARSMRVIRALLVVEVAFAIAPRRRRLARAVLGPEALHRCPRVNERAIDREVLARQKLLDLWQRQKRRQELVRHFRFQQPVAVVREHRRMPDLSIDRQADEPAEQQIVVDLLHQHPLGTHREERLQQRRPQQHLGAIEGRPIVE